MRCIVFDKQHKNPTRHQFHTRLRTLSETCEFADLEFEIEQQIIVGGTSTKMRKRALRDPKFDLKSMLIEGRRDQQSAYQAKQIEEPSDGETKKLEQQPRASSGVICRNCGRAYPHEGACPAKGKTCNYCKKPNHFAAVFRGKQKETQPSKPQARRAKSYKNNAPRNVKTLDTECLMIFSI